MISVITLLAVVVPSFAANKPTVQTETQMDPATEFSRKVPALPDAGAEPDGLDWCSEPAIGL